MNKLRVRTVVLSDIHLGTPESKVNEVSHFLEHVDCEKLILNGDIVDGWHLRGKGKWAKADAHFIRIILGMLRNPAIQIVYLRGNHDDFLARFIPFVFENFRIVDEHIHEGALGRYLVLHGDAFDSVTQRFRSLARFGAHVYHALLAVNRTYNRWRRWRGLEYWSVSRALKAGVKYVVSRVSRFEERILERARARGCLGVICGHIHTPANKMLGDIHYLNSGDWIESLTGIVEHWNGSYEIIEFSRFIEQFPPLTVQRVKEKKAPLSLEEVFMGQSYRGYDIERFVRSVVRESRGEDKFN